MMLGRRGEAEKAEILYAILAAVALLLFIAWMSGAFEKGALSAEEQKCRSSIQFHSNIVRLSGETAAPPINCEPRQVTVDDREEERAKEQLAKELLFCWERWQQGEAQLFKEEGSYCNPCSVITFKEGGKRIDGLWTFLDTAEAPEKGVTYATHLFPQFTEGHGPGDEEQERFPIDTDQQYAIVFYQDKNHSVKKFFTVLKDDPLRSAQILRRIRAYGARGAAAGGGAAAVFACLGPPSWAGGAALTAGGTFLGGLVGGGSAIFNGVPYPEWYSAVYLLPNDGEAYRSLGCTDVYQEGAPETVRGAENI